VKRSKLRAAAARHALARIDFNASFTGGGRQCERRGRGMKTNIQTLNVHIKRHPTGLQQPSP